MNQNVWCEPTNDTRLEDIVLRRIGSKKGTRATVGNGNAELAVVQVTDAGQKGVSVYFGWFCQRLGRDRVRRALHLEDYSINLFSST
jgi:hypothetical protein